MQPADIVTGIAAVYVTGLLTGATPVVAQAIAGSGILRVGLFAVATFCAGWLIGRVARMLRSRS